MVGAQARELFDDAQKLLRQIIAEKSLTARGVYGFWPANSLGDDVEIYRDEDRRQVKQYVTEQGAGKGHFQRPIQNVSRAAATSARTSDGRASAPAVNVVGPVDWLPLDDYWIGLSIETPWVARRISTAAIRTRPAAMAIANRQLAPQPVHRQPLHQFRRGVYLAVEQQGAAAARPDDKVEQHLALCSQQRGVGRQRAGDVVGNEALEELRRSSPSLGRDAHHCAREQAFVGHTLQVGPALAIVKPLCHGRRMTETLRSAAPMTGMSISVTADAGSGRRPHRAPVRPRDRHAQP